LFFLLADAVTILPSQPCTKSMTALLYGGMQPALGAFAMYIAPHVDELSACCACCYVGRYSRGQKFGKHVDDSVEVAPGQYTGYTLLVYLSGPLEGAAGSAGKGSKSGSSSQAAASSSSSSSGKGKRKAPGAGASQPVPINTSAVQELVGGETVFYGECTASGSAVLAVTAAVMVLPGCWSKLCNLIWVTLLMVSCLPVHV
jgi:hypothetical protein